MEVPTASVRWSSEQREEGQGRVSKGFWVLEPSRRGHLASPAQLRHLALASAARCLCTNLSLWKFRMICFIDP